MNFSLIPVASLQADAQLAVPLLAQVGPALVGSAALEVLVLFPSSLSFGYL